MPNGPDHYTDANRLLRVAHSADPEVSPNLSLEAIGHSLQALTAAVVMLVENHHDFPPYEIEAWRDVIPRPPLKECKGKEIRRPECIDRHTDDCAYADPPPKPTPDPVKQEPTGPRIYVQHYQGEQGHIVDVSSMNGELMFQVQWYAMGTEPVWKVAANLTIIPADQVDRCSNGQTRLDCGSGENQCELCLADEDEEAAEIEESMGLRDSPHSPGCPPINHRH